MSLALTTDETLLVLKIAFLVLLYLFVWVVVRSATRSVVAAPQESIVIGAADAAALRAAHGAPSARLTVVAGPALAAGQAIEIHGATSVGRGPENLLRLEGDTTVSSRHALFDSRTDGLWLSDVGSTNGTFVNEAPVTSPRLLQPGDRVRIGHTELVVD